MQQDTLQDYQEMFIQFGYVVLFSSAFPLAAMCALINNIIEIRSDALKLCTGLQRPFSQRVENIGQWQVRDTYALRQYTWCFPCTVFCNTCTNAGMHGKKQTNKKNKQRKKKQFFLCLFSEQTAMEAMGLIAIIVNCYLIGQCGQIQRLFPWLSPEMTIVSIVILEVF